MTDQEIMQSAKRHADGWRVTLDMDRESLCNEQQMAYDLLAAAERIRVLGEEVELSRKWERGLRRDLAGVVEFRPPHYPGVMRDLTEARAATDAARRGA